VSGTLSKVVEDVLTIMLPTNIAMLRNNFNAQMHDLADNMFTAAKKR